jgi:hypothetical protein
VIYFNLADVVLRKKRNREFEVMDTYRKCSLFFECNCKCLSMTYSWFYNYRSRRIYCAGITVPPDAKRTHQPSGELPVAPYGTGAHQGLQWTSPRLVFCGQIDKSFPSPPSSSRCPRPPSHLGLFHTALLHIQFRYFLLLREVGSR